MNLKSKLASKQRAGNQKLVDVLGPVDELESYVKADWWRHIFNANYLRTDGDVVNDLSITAREVDFLEASLGLTKDACLLDLCCGQGRHVIEFGRRGYTKLYGMDRSPYLINRAKATCRKEGLSVSFKGGDARHLPYDDSSFDAVMLLGNSFGYFETRHDDVTVLQEVLRVLKPGGRLLIDITDGDHMRATFEPRSWEWIDKQYFVCRERALSNDGERLVSREVITHVKKGVVADQFYAERLYSQDELQGLLTHNGFKDVNFLGALESESTRGQDLGMMAKRNIISGTCVKVVQIKVKDTRNKRVAVLLGDPGKNDRVKPGMLFDEDDFLTITALKDALSKLQGYRFEYFDKHDRYLTSLQRWKQDYDLIFNLCDEGFNNRADCELHVPALLEMQDIAYTGGNPQCLAYCYDKSLSRGIAREMDIPVPEAYFIRSDEISFIEINLPFPVIIKPNFGDSSFGITTENVCYCVEELELAIVNIRRRFGYDQPVLVEEFLTGKDITVGMIGNPLDGFTFLPIVEEDYSSLPEGMPKICGYEAKWDPSSPYAQLQSIPANLPASTEEFLQVSCMKLFERVGCRDYARFDWRLDANGTPRLLEINPNPGWCWDGHLAKMAAMINMNYSQMLGKILEVALRRIKQEYQSPSEVVEQQLK